MNEQVNPFEPPRAEIEPLAEEGAAGELLAEPRKLPAGRGAAWIGDSWELFKVSPGLWIVMIVVLLAIWVALSLIPLVSFFANVAVPIISGGWMISSHRAQTEGEVRFEDLFAGFTEHLAPLFILGLISLAASVAVMIAGVLVALPLFFGAIAIGEGAAFLGMILIIAVIMALMLPIMMAFWFAPALVVLNGVSPVDAIVMSFRGCLRNILPFLVYGVVGAGLLIAGAIPLFLGFLVVLPMLYCSVYTAYRDIYIEE